MLPILKLSYRYFVVGEEIWWDIMTLSVVVITWYNVGYYSTRWSWRITQYSERTFRSCKNWIGRKIREKFFDLVHSKSSSCNGSRCHFRYLLSWHPIPTRRKETLSKNSIDFTTIRITFFIIERNILSL